MVVLVVVATGGTLTSWFRVVLLPPRLLLLPPQLILLPASFLLVLFVELQALEQAGDEKIRNVSFKVNPGSETNINLDFKRVTLLHGDNS